MTARIILIVVGLFCSGLASVYGVKFSETPIGFVLASLGGLLLGIAITL